MSVSPPTATLKRPMTIIEIEKAPEVIALVHPKSVSNEFKKTPKAVRAPKLVNKIRKASKPMT